MAALQQLFMMVSTAAVNSAQIVAATYTRSGASPCGIMFKSDGTVWVKDGTTYTYRYNWKTGGGTGASYELRVTLDGGSPDSFSTGTMSTWQALSSDREYTRGSSNWVERTATGLFEIRDASTLVTLASNAISLVCDYGTGTPP